MSGLSIYWLGYLISGLSIYWLGYLIGYWRGGRRASRQMKKEGTVKLNVRLDEKQVQVIRGVLDDLNKLRPGNEVSWEIRNNYGLKFCVSIQRSSVFDEPRTSSLIPGDVAPPLGANPTWMCKLCSAVVPVSKSYEHMHDHAVMELAAQFNRLVGET